MQIYPITPTNDLWIYDLHVDHQSKELKVEDDFLLYDILIILQYSHVHYNQVPERTCRQVSRWFEDSNSTIQTKVSSKR